MSEHAPKLCRFSETFASRLDGWLESKPIKEKSLLFAEWVMGTAKGTKADELWGSLGVEPTTVSRWLNGSYKPQASNLRRMVTYFELPPDTDLRETPLFLSEEPVALTDRRNWLHSRLNALSSADLRDLYPALRRLLEER
jgi:transcriptional regulator with XRE-family HTH domain